MRILPKNKDNSLRPILLLSVNLFSTDESINWGLYFLRFLLERWPLFTRSSEPREGPATSSAKRVPPWLSYFKALSIGPAPGIEPAISRSLVKHSTDWANPTERSGVERKKNLWLPWPRISIHTKGPRIGLGLRDLRVRCLAVHSMHTLNISKSDTDFGYFSRLW